MMSNRTRPQANRTVLGVLLAVLAVAILLALWFLIFDRGDDSASGSNGQSALPTPVTIPTSAVVVATAPPVVDATAPTTAPVTPATPVPEGFQVCTAAQAPVTTTTYVVDTNTTPLNQRAEPAVGADQAGTFDPGQANLVFSGECVVNVNDGYTWWKIFNGTIDVWVASDFVTPN